MSVYPSKVDLWLAVVLIISPLLIIGTGIFKLSVNKPAALIAIAWANLFISKGLSQIC